MARRTPKGQETRERIMAAALSEFARRGYTAVTLEEIADAAHVTKGAVYYWFADKDDLGRELQHDLYDRLSHTSMRALDLNGSTVDNLARGFEIYLDALGDLGEARFFLRDAWTIPALDEAGRRDQEAAVELIRDVLARGVERGELEPLDPEALARVLLGAWNEATLHVLTTGRRDETAAVVRHLIQSLDASHDSSLDTTDRKAPDPEMMGTA